MGRTAPFTAPATIVRLLGMDNANIFKPLGKLGLAAVAVVVGAIVLYLVAWLHLYIIGGVVWLIQSIF